MNLISIYNKKKHIKTAYPKYDQLQGERLDFEI